MTIRGIFRIGLLFSFSLILQFEVNGQSIALIPQHEIRSPKIDRLFISGGIASISPRIKTIPYPDGATVWSDSIESVTGITRRGAFFELGCEWESQSNTMSTISFGFELLNYDLNYRATPNRLFSQGLNVNRIFLAYYYTVRIGEKKVVPLIRFGGSFRTGLNFKKLDEEPDIRLWDLNGSGGFGLELKAGNVAFTPEIEYRVGMIDQLIRRQSPFTEPIEKLRLNAIAIKLAIAPNY